MGVLAWYWSLNAPGNTGITTCYPFPAGVKSKGYTLCYPFPANGNTYALPAAGRQMFSTLLRTHVPCTWSRMRVIHAYAVNKPGINIIAPEGCMYVSTASRQCE